VNNLTRYLAVRNQIRAGDLIVFQGSGPLSGLIEGFSAGPSHAGIIRVIDRDATGAKVVKMVESTIEDNRNGVQTNRLSERLANYDDGGRAWWLPLAGDIHQAIDWFKFYQFIGGAEDHVRYDTSDLFEFILRGFPIIGPRIGQSEHRDRMVCSGFVTAVLEAAGVLRGINWSKVTPQDLVEMKLYRQCVQVLGKPAILRRFNSL
jgi:hypothetical protein